MGFSCVSLVALASWLLPGVFERLAQDGVAPRNWPATKPHTSHAGTVMYHQVASWVITPEAALLGALACTLMSKPRRRTGRRLGWPPRKLEHWER